MSSAKPNNNDKKAVHAGWSEPPPFDYVQNQAIGYTPYYRLPLQYFDYFHKKKRF